MELGLRLGLGSPVLWLVVLSPGWSFCPLVGRFVSWLVVLSPGLSFCLLVGRFVPWLVVLSPGRLFCPLVCSSVPWLVVLSPWLVALSPGWPPATVHKTVSRAARQPPPAKLFLAPPATRSSTKLFLMPPTIRPPTKLFLAKLCSFAAVRNTASGQNDDLEVIVVWAAALTSLTKGALRIPYQPINDRNVVRRD